MNRLSGSTKAPAAKAQNRPGAVSDAILSADRPREKGKRLADNSNNSDGTGLAGGAGAPGATGAPVQTNDPAALTTEALNEHALDAHPLDAIQDESPEAIPGAPAGRTANAAEGGADARPAILDAASGGNAKGSGADDSAADGNGTNGSSSNGASGADALGVVVPQPELSEALSSDVDGEAPHKDVPGGRAYEIIFIGQPSDADANEASTMRLRAMIEDGGGAIDNVRTSETRRLAYPIAGQIEGVYVVVNTRFEASHIPELDRFFKLEESVLRHMILREES